jgi:predicted amidohydrolase
MRVAAAQTIPVRGNIEANIFEHIRLVMEAVRQNIDLIVFPEMSITGYERENAHALAFVKNDARLDTFTALSNKHHITIVVGAPIKIDANLFIGSFIISPNEEISIYTKQFLHEGEEVYYQSSFDYNPILEIGDERISCAICADIDHSKHPENACKNNSSTYIASIFFSPNGIPQAHQSLQSYAAQYQMNVLMANFGGDSYGSPSGGRSAFWNNKGELIAQMEDSGSGLLIVEHKNSSWIGQIINDK